MAKKICITFLLIVIFITLATTNYAIDMNLNNVNTQTSTNNTVSNESNTENSNTTNNENQSENTNTQENTNTTTPQKVYNNIPEADLGLQNILNILLITVGVLIILLAVAILIRIDKK